MERIKEFFRRPQVWGFIVSVAVLAVLSLAFFYPDNFEGNSLRQADMQQGAANGQEGKLFEEATGEKALWTDALFGGMPTFQISPSYPSNSLFTWLNTVYGLGLPAPSNLLFMMMFGFLILLFVLRLGLFELFRHNNRSRPHMEIRDPELRASHDSRTAAALPAPLYRRSGLHSAFRDAAAECQPRADELLFRYRLRHPGYMLSH